MQMKSKRLRISIEAADEKANVTELHVSQGFGPKLKVKIFFGNFWKLFKRLFFFKLWNCRVLVTVD